MADESSDQRAIVIGAGVIGIACAHYLSQAGFRVTVIDRGRIGDACSKANCGYICPSHVLPLTEPGAIAVAAKSLLNPRAPFRVKPRLSPAMWNWMWQFTRRCNRRQMLTAGTQLQSILNSSMSEYRTLMQSASLAADSQWKTNGLLYVLRSDDAMSEFAKTDSFLSENFGVSATRIAGVDLPAFDPALRDGLAGAFHYDCDTSVRPDRLNQSWVAALRRQGVDFIENCELQKVTKQNGQILGLVTSEGTMIAEQYVFAVGAWSPKFAADLECHIPIEPGKGYSVTMQRPEICPRYPTLFPEEKVGVSPFSDGWRLGSMMEFAGYDTSIPASRIQQLKDSARPYLAAPIAGGHEETWYGWRPMTWDSLPIIGPVPNLERAFLATGHNMLGLSLAPATGKLIAEMATRRSPHIDPAPYSPSRF